MKYNIEAIFGKEQVDKILNGNDLSIDEKSINLKKYSFDSKEKLEAFIKGINEAIGWSEVYVQEK